jgi:hypothetical protein
MGRSVVLLRGINVGRAQQVPMPVLADVLAGLGYTGVRTHLRSGNAVVDHARPLGRGAAVAIEDGVRLATGVTRGRSRSATSPTTPPASSSPSSTSPCARSRPRRPPT